jgi:hypothetical protein
MNYTESWNTLQFNLVNHIYAKDDNHSEDDAYVILRDMFAWELIEFDSRELQGLLDHQLTPLHACAIEK